MSDSKVASSSIPPPGEDFEFHAFISYQSQDQPFAKQVFDHLTDAGFRVWFDVERLRPGFQWAREIHDGIEKSRIVLPILTSRWRTSWWTRFETYGAQAIIPLVVDGKIDDLAPGPIKYHMGKSISFSTVEPSDWNKLIAGMHELLALPIQRKNDRRWAVPNTITSQWFTGREEKLNEIHEGLHPGPSTTATQVGIRALFGLGGVGKTTLAREYAERYWRAYKEIYWVDASQNLDREFARIGRLGLVPDAPPNNDPEVARMAVDALNRNGPDRLLILDNAPEESSELKARIPRAGTTWTLITSRYASWGEKGVDLGVFSEEEAVAFLLKRTERAVLASADKRHDTEARELAAALGYLPLALEQAASYIRNQNTTFGEYLDLFLAIDVEVFEQPGGMIGTTDYAEPVLRTWLVTEQKLDMPAQVLLRLCSLLSPAWIPEGFAKEAGVYIAGLASAAGEETAGPAGSPERLVAHGLKQLTDYSMITRLRAAEPDVDSPRPDGAPGFTIHRLVSAVQRYHMTPDVGAVSAGILHEMLSTFLHFEQADDATHRWATRWNWMSPHCGALLQRPLSEQSDLSLVPFFTYFSNYLRDRHRTEEANAVATRQIEYHESRFDQGTGTFADRVNAATALARRGALNKALGHYREAEGDLGEGRQGFEAVLALQPDNGEVHGNLGGCLLGLGELRITHGAVPEARACYSQALASLEEALRLEPNSSIFYLNRGNTFQRLGEISSSLREMEASGSEYSRAVASYDAALKLQPGMVDAHVNRTAALLRLGELGLAAGDYGRAAKFLRQCLDGCENSVKLAPLFSEVHSMRGAALARLGEVAGHQRDHSQAAEHFREAVRSFDTAVRLAPQSVEAIDNRGNALQSMANLLTQVGQLEGALKFALDAIECYDRALQLVPTHLFTLSNRARAYFMLGLLHEQQGRRAESIKSFRESIATSQKAVEMNPNFPDALLAYANAAMRLAQHGVDPKEGTTASRWIERGKRQVSAFLTLRPGDQGAEALLKAFSGLQEIQSGGPGVDPDIARVVRAMANPEDAEMNAQAIAFALSSARQAFEQGDSETFQNAFGTAVRMLQQAGPRNPGHPGLLACLDDFEALQNRVKGQLHQNGSEALDHLKEHPGDIEATLVATIHLLNLAHEPESEGRRAGLLAQSRRLLQTALAAHPGDERLSTLLKQLQAVEG